MSTPILTNNSILLPEAPAIPNLTFRRFRGEEDFPRMQAVIEGSKNEDRIERVTKLEELRNDYNHLVNCDPFQDMLIVEVNSQVVGYSRVFWEALEDSTCTYNLFGYLLPEWRHKGIGTAMLHYNEERLRKISAAHTATGPRFFQSWAVDTEKSTNALLKSQGYHIVRYGLNMVRDLSEPFPEAPMPAGLEVRPARAEHFRTIFDALNEAFMDHWGVRRQTWDEFEGWMESTTTFTPELWKIAWEGDQVAGTVLNFINAAENEEYDRKRGYTEGICVRRNWRKRGLARSLIVQSMQMFKEMGMTETALGVDAENISGALRLYTGVGYREVKRNLIYRKPMV